MLALILWVIGALDAYLVATNTILKLTRWQIARRVIIWPAYTLVWAIEAWLERK